MGLGIPPPNPEEEERKRLLQEAEAAKAARMRTRRLRKSSKQPPRAPKPAPSRRTNPIGGNATDDDDDDDESKDDSVQFRATVAAAVEHANLHGNHAGATDHQLTWLTKNVQQLTAQLDALKLEQKQKQLLYNAGKKEVRRPCVLRASGWLVGLHVHVIFHQDGCNNKPFPLPTSLVNRCHPGRSTTHAFANTCTYMHRSTWRDNFAQIFARSCWRPGVLNAEIKTKSTSLSRSSSDSRKT